MPSIPDSHRDLLDGMVATLATIGSNGYPQMSELWFLAEGDTIRLSLNTSRQKTRNLMKRPACGLLLLDLANPGRYLELRGDAQIEPDPDTSSPTGWRPSTVPTCVAWTSPASRGWS